MSANEREGRDFFVREFGPGQPGPLESIDSVTIREELPGGKIVCITVGLDEQRLPFGVTVNAGKSGSWIQADAEAMAGLVNRVLFKVSRNEAREEVEALIEILRRPGTSESVGFGTEKISSLPQAIALALRKCLEAEAADEEA